MKQSGGNALERLAGDLPPSMILLAAMLENQIDDLARLHARGVWRESPQEIGGNIAGCCPGSGEYETRVAMEEWLLWPRTEVLIEALENYTPIRIDRGRIVSLAKRRSEELSRDGRVRRWRGKRTGGGE